MIKSRAITLALVAGGVTACGITISILLQLLVVTIVDQYMYEASSETDMSAFNSMKKDSVLWVIGLVYIVPGAFGFIAAFVQNKCLYITACVFCLISLILMGLLVFFGGYVLLVLIMGFGNITEHCRDTPNGCECFAGSEYEHNYREQLTPFRNCSGLETVASLVIGILSLTIVAWIVMLFECILSCYYACRPVGATEGVVMYTPATQQPQMIPMECKPGMSQQPYPPPAYGSQNMYYDEGLRC